MMAKGFTSLEEVITKILKAYGLENKVEENKAIAYWPEVVGTRVRKITEPWKVVDGKLFVRVANPSWRTELVMMKPMILEKLNRKIGKKVIREILFV